MRVLLVGPDLQENLSLRYLSASLARAGHAAKIATFDSAEDTEAVLAASDGADLVGLSMCYQIRAPEFLALARALKARRPDRPVVAGGHFASCAGRQLLSHHREIDAIAIHESEATLAQMASLDRLTPSTLSQVRGILHRAGGNVIATPPRETAEDLDLLPWPDRSGPARLMVGVPTAYLVGSRGCLYSCDYCSITTLHKLVRGKRFRQRTSENIAAEMACLYSERGVRQFIFHDDNFLVPDKQQNLERIDALDRAMRHRGLLDVGLVVKCRPAEVDRDVFLRLRAMGLVRVFLGIESATTAGLASIGRRQTVADEHRALSICEELGISTQYTIILFHPEATPSTMLDDLAFVREHPAHPMSFCRAEIYAGTPLERRMVDTSRASGNYLARAYGYTDKTTALVWSYAKELLRERCFAPKNLMGQVIQLDHLAAVFGHFYQGRHVDDLGAAFRAFELDVNRDTVTLIEDLVRACIAHGERSSEIAVCLDELRDREASRCRIFEERACAFSAGLDAAALRVAEELGSSTAGPSTRRLCGWIADARSLAG
jgi:radical SAM superfamily enzyme YgiQ (UPF0313 family)